MKLFEKLADLQKRLREAESEEDRKTILDEIDQLTADAEAMDKKISKNNKENEKLRLKLKESGKTEEEDEKPEEKETEKPDVKPTEIPEPEWARKLRENLEAREAKEAAAEAKQKRDVHIKAAQEKHGFNRLLLANITGETEEEIMASADALAQELADEGLSASAGTKKSTATSATTMKAAITAAVEGKNGKQNGEIIGKALASDTK